MPDAAQDALDARYDAARTFARLAGQLTLTYFRDRTFEVEHKGDGSHVTEADRRAETLLRERITEMFPDDGILGEEHDEKPGTSGYRWILDPIDGTASFVHGVPMYGTLVAVEYSERSVIGVIYIPPLDEMVSARVGGGTWHQVGADAAPRPAHVSDTTSLEDAMICTTSPRYYFASDRRDPYLRLISTAGRIRGWSDCYAFVLVATGRADGVVEPILFPWDVAAMIPIIEEAGGRITGWNGTVSAFAGDGFASNGAIHDQLQRVLNGR